MAVDLNDLELKFSALTIPVTPVPPAPGIPPLKPSTIVVQTPATLLPTDVNAIGFIRFTSAQLNDHDGILNFYNALQSQGMQFNVFLRDADLIDASYSVIPDGMTSHVVMLTRNTLYTKLCQDKVICSTYTDAVSLRDTTTCGY